MGKALRDLKIPVGDILAHPRTPRARCHQAGLPRPAGSRTLVGRLGPKSLLAVTLRERVPGDTVGILRAGKLVRVARLEDLAGNNLERPFEVDVFRPIQRKIKAKTVKVTFQVLPK